jgi:hypothetical protein
MDGYDLQDTLVHINYSASFGKRQLLDNISKAEILYKPTGDFVIVTAQQDDREIHTVIRDMVEANFPKCQGVYFVSGSEQEVIDKKAASIARLKLSSFTDNNLDILAGIKAKNLGVRLFKMTKTGRKPY